MGARGGTFANSPAYQDVIADFCSCRVCYPFQVKTENPSLTGIQAQKCLAGWYFVKYTAWRQDVLHPCINKTKKTRLFPKATLYLKNIFNSKDLYLYINRDIYCLSINKWSMTYYWVEFKECLFDQFYPFCLAKTTTHRLIWFSIKTREGYRASKLTLGGKASN